MGAVLGLPCLACFFGNAACQLCCSCLSCCKSSIATRLSFAFLLIFCTSVCLVMLAPGLRDDLRKIPFLCDATIFPNGTDVASACDRIVGYEAVYRMCFALSCFFFLFATIMVGVRSSKDFRAKIQNGFWPIKFCILIGLIIGAFYIPYGEPGEIDFAKVWMWFGMVGAVIFIIIQLILLLDSIHALNANWIKKSEDAGKSGNRWVFLVVLCTFIFYSLAIAAVILLYIYYGKEGCIEHQVFISINLTLCVLVSVISILPAVRERFPYSGLFPSSAVSLYAIYITWCGMSNNPDRNCNPNLFRHFFQPSPTNYNATSSNSTGPADFVDTSPVAKIDPVAIVSIVIWLGSLIFSCLRSSRSSTADRLTFSPSRAEPVVYAAVADHPDQLVDDEEDTTVYSYSLFHLMLMLSSMYIMMTLTSWFKLSPDLTTLKTNVTAMWVKMATSWAVFFFYLWSLLAPMICPGRFEQ